MQRNPEQCNERLGCFLLHAEVSYVLNKKLELCRPTCVSEPVSLSFFRWLDFFKAMCFLGLQSPVYWRTHPCFPIAKLGDPWFLICYSSPTLWPYRPQCAQFHVIPHLLNVYGIYIMNTISLSWPASLCSFCPTLIHFSLVLVDSSVFFFFLLLKNGIIPSWYSYYFSILFS